MNAVSIDASKDKSTVTIRRPGDEVVMAPRDIRRTQSSISELISIIKGLDGETKVCMEHIGRYYEPVATWLSDAGIFVSTVNPILIRNFGEDSIRTPKTDKADAKKIARFTLDRWFKLRQYSRVDEIRNQLKTMNRQFGFYMDQKTAMKNNLIALLDQTFPGADKFFDSPARSDGSQKWVDFVIPIGTLTVSARSRRKRLPSITARSASTRATTLEQARRRKCIMPLPTSLLCSQRTTTPSC